MVAILIGFTRSLASFLIDNIVVCHRVGVVGGSLTGRVDDRKLHVLDFFIDALDEFQNEID